MSLSGFACYTEDVGASYLASAACEYAPHTMNLVHGVIQRLNCFASGKKYKKRVLKPQPQCPELFKPQVDGWTSCLEEKGLSEFTILRYKIAVVNVLLDFLHQGIQSLSDLKQENTASAFGRSRDKKLFPVALRSFFEHLEKEGCISHELIDFMPKRAPDNPAPNVYSESEILALLKCIDRTAASGKRNYAIMMLVCKQGLRPCDIADLRLGELDLEKKTLTKEQVRRNTKSFLEMTLDPEVFESLSDYISSSRPESSSDHVFLTLDKPVRELRVNALHLMVIGVFKRAGIETNGRKRSACSLRMRHNL
jgi:integrase